MPSTATATHAPHQIARTSRRRTPQQRLTTGARPAPRHAQIVDLQWCPAAGSSWALLSVSEDSDEAAGGTMQIWRINDMIHRPHDEVVAELEQHRCARWAAAGWQEPRCWAAGGGEGAA
jgi:hypothetical protein